MKLYTKEEIHIIIRAIDCIQDVQHLADYLAENRFSYSLMALNSFSRLLKIYIGLYL